MSDDHLLRNHMLSHAVSDWSRSQFWRRRTLASSMAKPLDRVNVLSGHTGCVNALSWAREGEILLSGGDDTTVRMWRVDARDAEATYPLVCQSVINTGHRANIFNAQMLPTSSRIATVAGDKQVRIFDVNCVSASGADNTETQLYAQDLGLRVLRCHSDRVKRIVTDESPDLFLTVSEDGTVRQHDLRASHNCSPSECPAPLVKLTFELMSLSLSPLTPYQFVVGGDSSYGYLYDRRHTGRFMQEEWGIPPHLSEETTCVRRFGVRKKVPGSRKRLEHITGARVSSTNGHEVLLSYSGDAVYLYSTKDSIEDNTPKSSQSAILPANDNTGSRDNVVENVTAPDSTISLSPRPPIASDGDAGIDESQDAEEEAALNEDDNDEESPFSANIPVLFPRASFSGACNVRTVKDVNFLGPNDEYIVSGSDDGNWFIWDKSRGTLKDVLEGDGSVVNVIEGHPHLPIVAVSGIDHTVKLFGPVEGQSEFSRLRDANDIIDRNLNALRHRPPQPIDMATLLMNYGLARITHTEEGLDELETQCRHQ